jgi:Xaa-Pro aminopeptidase
VRYEPIDPTLFVQNRARLAALLAPGSLAVCNANDIMPTNADGVMGFKQNADLFYLSGVDQPEAALLLFPDHPDPTQREILFVKETSESRRIWDGPLLNQAEARATSGVQNVQWLSGFERTFRGLMQRAENVYLNLNEQARSAAAVPTHDDRFVRECRERYPLHQYRRLAPLLARCRMVKSPAEVALLRTACAITEAGFRRVLGAVRPGLGEWEIEAELAHEFLRRRAVGFAYPPIIASGASACILHYGQNHGTCMAGDLLLLDIGACWAHYCADLTRTVPVSGRFTPRQRAVYAAVLRVQREAMALLRPGVVLRDYENDVKRLMDGALVDLGLITAEAVKNQTEEEPPRRQYFMHGASHHLGLDVHDVTVPDQPLEPGMVLTVEPGIYIRAENLGLRLEQNVLITASGNENLMASIPIEPDEIEALMAPGPR